MAYNPYLKQNTAAATPTPAKTFTPANPYMRAGIAQAQSAQTTTQATATAQKPANAYQKKYKQESVMNMTPGELLLKLYEEIIKQLNIAITSIDDQEDSKVNEEETAEQLKLQNEAARKMAIEHLESTARKMFEDENQEYTEADLKAVITEKAIDDMVKQYNVKLNNNGGKAKNSHNYALIEKRHHAIQKISKILDHLRMTLNFDYEISNNLNALYEFFKKSINDANNSNESKPLKDIMPLVVDLYDAYSAAEQNVKSGKSE